MILSFVTNLYKKISSYANKIYATSKLKVINETTVSSVTKASEHSFICNFMSSKPKTVNYYKHSFLYTFLSSISSFFKRIADKIKLLLDKSIIFKFCSFIANNLMNIPVNIYGLFLLSFGIVSGFQLFFNTLNTACIITTILSLIFGFMMLISKTSLNQILYSSKVYNFIIKLFSKNEYDIEFHNKNILRFSKIAYILVSIAGVCLGIASYFISSLAIAILIIGVIGLLLVIKDFRIGAYLSVFMFPFMPTMAIVGVLLLSLVSLFIKCLFDKSFSFSKTGLDIYIVLFSIIIAISGITSFDRATSINIALVYIVFILSYFVFTNTIIDKKSLYVSFAMLLAGGVIVSLYGIYQYVFGFSEGNIWIDTDMFTGIETRVVSTFENPNVLGEYLLIIIPICIAYFFESGSLKEKWASVFAAGILILCMVFTFSRGCWIGMIVSFGILSLFYDRRFVWAGIILILFSPLYLPESIIQRFLSVGDTSDTSTSYRVYIWFGTIDMLKDYWITGIGLGEGAFNVIYPHYAYSAIVAPHSHNLYLQVLVENGIVGFVVFTVMVIAFYKNSIYALVKTNRSFLKVSLLALVSAMTGYLVQGLFDNVWYNYRVFMFFFMTFAITMKCSDILLNNEHGRRGECDD